MRKRLTLGDIVTMPLPTEWGPEVLPPGNGVPTAYTSTIPGAATAAGGGPAVIPGSPGTPIAVGSPDGLPPGSGPNGLRIPGTTVGTGFPPPAFWVPDAILPDSMLPEALQRSNPLVRRTVFSPNQYDYELVRKARAFAWIAAHGGLKSCCRIPDLGAPIWSQPPWQVMPSNGLEYRQMFSQPIAAFQNAGAFTGLPVIIGQWRVEIGYDGILNQFVCGFTGDGFEDFSGDITWRVQVNNRNAKNLGAVINTFGSFADAFLVPGYGIRLVSGQTVTLYATVAVGAGISGGNITAGTFGWTYPRR